MLAIQVQVFSTDPIKPAELAKSKYRTDATQEKGQMEIEIPQQRGEGRYKVVIELLGSIGKRQGVLDREVFFQVTEGDRPQLVTPSDLRELDQRRRNDAFLEGLRKDPDRPDIRLLAPDTVRVPEELRPQGTTIAELPQLQVRGTGPSGEVRRYVVDKAGTAWSSSDPITVRGRLSYLDFEGTWRPLVNASVNLYDDDTFGDEHLGTTATDWSGDWSFTVNNDDGWLQNGRDVYYRFPSLAAGGGLRCGRAL